MTTAGFQVEQMNKVAQSLPHWAHILQQLQNSVFSLSGERLWTVADAQSLLALPTCFVFLGTLGAERMLEQKSLISKENIENTLAAYACYQCVADEADLLSIGVLPQYRKRGFAAAMLRESIQTLGKNGTKRFFLEVRADNAPALRLYNHIGYQRQGLRKKYYRLSDGSEIDAVQYRLVLQA